MPRRRASGEEIVDHFDSYPNSAGSTEERVKATARYFNVKPGTVHKHLKFWWPGKKYLKEFGENTTNRVRWDRPTEKLLAAVTRHGSVAGAARALKTTPITLTKALQRHHIVQTWVLEKPGKAS